MAAKSRNRKRKPAKASNAQAVTTGTTIRMEEAASERKPRPSKPKVIVQTVTQEVNPVHNFFDFLKQHAVIGLIIGFVLGAQVQVLVRETVENFIDPMTKLLFGQSLREQTFSLSFRDRSEQFGWGQIAYSVIIFILVIIIMYVVIKLLNLDELIPDKDDKDKK